MAYSLVPIPPYKTLSWPPQGVIDGILFGSDSWMTPSLLLNSIFPTPLTQLKLNSINKQSYLSLLLVAWLKEIGMTRMKETRMKEIRMDPVGPLNISMETEKFDEVLEEAKKILATEGGTGFANICLYNSLATSGDAKEGIEALMTIYGNLLGLHG
jgi:hypothetical protein